MKGSKMYLSYGLETIYEDAEFLLHKQDKVGIVGVNGAGKTTLFRVLLHEQKLDGGTISIGTERIGYLPQEIVMEDEGISVWDYLMDGRPIHRLNTELEDIYIRLETASLEEQEPLLSRMAEIQESLEYYDCYEAEDILLTLIEEMQIDADLLDRPLAELSGGQKSKMAFARVLFSKPEILLLDEPTNHLDASTKDYVTEYLKNYTGMVLIISHDVDFLNQIINKVLFINKVTHKISVYEGNYNTFKKKYAQEKRLREQAIVKQEKEIKELSDFVQRAKQASQTNHAIKRMGQERALRLEKKRRELQTRERAYKRVKMDIRPKRETPRMPLEVERLAFAYLGQPSLYEDLSFRLNGGERFW